VHPDRLRAGVDAELDEFLAEPDDLLLEAVPNPGWRPLRSP
jgi:hypothetical protein